jgi:cytochrome c oxidase subunit 2
MWSFPLFPEQASSSAKSVDLLYYALMTFSLFFSLLILVLLVIFAIKYRRTAEVNRTMSKKGYLKLEFTWAFIPFVAALGLFTWAARLYFDLNDAPSNAMEIYVVARQWMWKIQHTEGNREINELHIPVGRAVKLVMTSQDVIHSFYIPAFRIKEDVLPAKYSTEWFNATKVGEYHLFCAEYCGVQHSGMVGKVVVMDPSHFQNWLNADTSARSMATTGERLFERFGCRTCHSPESTNSQLAPSLIGLYGKPITLPNGRAMTVDRNYLRNAILTPQRSSSAAFQQSMPSYKGQLTADELGQLVEYIKNLNPLTIPPQGSPGE